MGSDFVIKVKRRIIKVCLRNPKNKEPIISYNKNTNNYSYFIIIDQKFLSEK